MSDPTAQDILNGLSAYFASDAAHDQAMAEQVSALQAQVTADAAAQAALQAQIDALTPQVAALSVPKKFAHITVSDGPTPHCRIEFFNGLVVDRDFPAQGDLDFAIDLAVGG